MAVDGSGDASWVGASWRAIEVDPIARSIEGRLGVASRFFRFSKLNKQSFIHFFEKQRFYACPVRKGLAIGRHFFCAKMKVKRLLATDFQR